MIDSSKADDYKTFAPDDIGLPLDEWSVANAYAVLERHGIKVPRWIKIEPGCEMPEDPGWVLVYADGAIACRAWTRGEWRDWQECGAPGLVMDEITHWMPLPAPPTENQE